VRRRQRSDLNRCTMRNPRVAAMTSIRRLGAPNP
jgi:hypothetical protein